MAAQSYEQMVSVEDIYEVTYSDGSDQRCNLSDVFRTEHKVAALERSSALTCGAWMRPAPGATTMPQIC